MMNTHVYAEGKKPEIDEERTNRCPEQSANVSSK
jgi:hypothetical protein